MDAQRKKGILDVCVLAVLKKGPSYGYQIIRDVSRCTDISESTLYPILKRLEQNGSLRTYRLQYNGRTRKYYELTEEGQHRIDVFLEEWDELQRMYQFIEKENQAVSGAGDGSDTVEESTQDSPDGMEEPAGDGSDIVEKPVQDSPDRAEDLTGDSPDGAEGQVSDSPDGAEDQAGNDPDGMAHPEDSSPDSPEHRTDACKEPEETDGGDWK